MTSPLWLLAGYPAEASTTVTQSCGFHSTLAPASSPDAAAAQSSSRSLSSRGSTACVSGSPKRQLNSSTLTPASVTIRPAYSTPR